MTPQRGARVPFTVRSAAVATMLLVSACGGGPGGASDEPGPSAPLWSGRTAEAEGMEALDVPAVAPSPAVVSGRRFMTKCVGNGSGSVLLVSGWTAPMKEWESIQAKLGSVARTCSYDRLGIGESGPLPPSQTFTTFAADIDLLIEELDLPRPIVIVGQSLGGPIAMTWATSHPGDTAGVVLVDAPDAAFFEWQAEAMTDEQKANLYDPMASVADDAEHVDRPTSYAELKDLASLDDLPLEVLTHDPDSPNGIETELGEGVPEEETAREWLAAQRRWQGFSSRSELVTVVGAGHSIQLDDPDAVVAAVLVALG